MIDLGFVSAIGVVIDLSPSSALDSRRHRWYHLFPTSGAGGEEQPQLLLILRFEMGLSSNSQGRRLAEVALPSDHGWAKRR